MRRRWTETECELLRQSYPDTPSARIAAQLERKLAAVYNQARKLGLRKSEAFLRSPESGTLQKGQTRPGSIATQFKKGLVPANKGLRRPGWYRGRMRETQFRRGERRGFAAKNWRPLGTILRDADGYLRIKVCEARRGEATGFGNTKVWPLLQRVVWERERGPIPPGHAVVFRDRDKANCNPGNLECISRAELMRRNTVHNLPAPLVEVIRLKGAIRATATRKNKKARAA